MAACWVATLVLMAIVGQSRIKADTAMGLVLSVFFGLGLVLLTLIQKRMQTASQAGLDSFLFGQAAALLERDVVVMAVLAALVLALMGLFWKEFKLLSFDPEFGASLGFHMRGLDVLLTTLLVVAIVLGLQAVGVVLMSAMVVAPAAAARQWTDRLALMVALSALFGAAAGVMGVAISSMAPRLPTGPVIVVCISAIAGLSITFAPNRGLVADALRRWRRRRRLQVAAVLSDMYELAMHHEEFHHAHSAEVVRKMSGERGGVVRSLRELHRRGWAEPLPDGRWALTPEGAAQAEQFAAGRGSEEP